MNSRTLDAGTDGFTTSTLGVEAICVTAMKSRAASYGPWEFHSEKWEIAYIKRVDATISALKSAGIPVIWVGLPSQRGAKASTDSGLIRYDQRREGDWPQAARDIIAAEKPKYILMMVGNNDRQSIREKMPPVVRPGTASPAGTRALLVGMIPP